MAYSHFPSYEKKGLCSALIINNDISINEQFCQLLLLVVIKKSLLNSHKITLTRFTRMVFFAGGSTATQIEASHVIVCSGYPQS